MLALAIAEASKREGKAVTFIDGFGRLRFIGVFGKLRFIGGFILTSHNSRMPFQAGMAPDGGLDLIWSSTVIRRIPGILRIQKRVWDKWRAFVRTKRLFVVTKAFGDRRNRRD